MDNGAGPGRAFHIVKAFILLGNKNTVESLKALYVKSNNVIVLSRLAPIRMSRRPTEGA